MSTDETRLLTRDDIAALRDALNGLYDDESHPIELSLGGGLYIGFYPASSKKPDELGVSYVYVADPAHHFDTPAPEMLSEAPSELKTLCSSLRAVLCDVTGYSYQFKRTDDEQGGVYYAAVMRRQPSTTPPERES